MLERRVGLVTRDPVLYGELAVFFRERRVPTVSLLPGQTIPGRVAVVVTSAREAASIRFNHIVVAVPGDLMPVWAAVQEALGGRKMFDELVVGIDPGDRPGYAVIGAGGRCLARGTASSPEDVAGLGRRIREGFPDAELRFRVGSGDRIHRSRIVNALLPLRRPVEVVDETSTTLPGRRENDVLAALAIAATPGVRVRHHANVRISKGEVANLQRISRQRSGGRLTIPRDLAVSVLEGRLTLEAALRRVEGGLTTAAGSRRRGASLTPRPVALSPVP